MKLLLKKMAFLVCVIIHVAVLSAMELDDNSLVSNQDLSWTKDPSINHDGVCHLVKLPKDILCTIAQYLIFSEEETNCDFLKRVSRSGHWWYKNDILMSTQMKKTKFGIVYISSEGSLN